MTIHARSSILAFAVLTIAAVSSAAAKESAQRDYRRLSGEWQLTRAVVDGREIPKRQLQRTVLITDGDTFRFPQGSRASTHPAGRFTVNPNTVPKQVDSVAIGGKNAGQVTLGIYEIIDDKHKRACWAAPGHPRPASFASLPGSKHILQYWTKIGPVPKNR